MSPNYKILFPIALFFFLACGPKQIISIPPARVEPGDELFLKAEKMFQAKSYKNALASYNEYLAKFPDQHLAAPALMKIGAIYTALGNNEKARSIYNRLIREYPASPLALDARVERLATYYHEGKYQEVIRQAAAVMKDTKSRIHLFKIYSLLGDTYWALSSPEEAVCLYITAYSKFKDLAKENIVAKLKKILGQLDSKEVTLILTRLEDRRAKGNFLYLLGLSQARDEKYHRAVKNLSELIKMYPEHEMVQPAKSLLEELSKKSIYSRYTIGCILPLSGPYKIYGQRALKGIELALTRFSSQNTNPSLKIIIKDTGSDPDKAVIAVRELFQEHVAAIIGPLITAESAASEAQDKQIPIITLTQKDKITEIGNYVFRNFLTPEMQTKTIVSYAINKLGVRNFAILYPEENYGTTYMNLFWDEVIDQGGKVVGVESYHLTQTDFADPIKKLVGLYYKVPENLKHTSVRSAEEALLEPIFDFNAIFASPVNRPGELYHDLPEDLINLTLAMEEEEITDEKDDREKEPEPIIDFEAIFIPDAPNKVGLIIPQLAFYDVKDIYLLGTNLWHSDNLIKMARQYVQGAILTEGFFEASSSKSVKEFVNIFQKCFQEKPEFIEAVAYDTATILFRLVSRPDIRFRSEIKDALMNLSWPGLTGITSFDSNGEVHKKPFLLRIKGDKFIELFY